MAGGNNMVADPQGMITQVLGPLRNGPQVVHRDGSSVVWDAHPKLHIPPYTSEGNREIRLYVGSISKRVPQVKPGPIPQFVIPAKAGIQKASDNERY
jgi:hypothetical protein